MPPKGLERVIEPGIYYKRDSGVYSVRVTIAGRQVRRSAGGSLENARRLLEQMQREREAAGQPRTNAHTADRLPLTQLDRPEEYDHVSTENATENQEAEIPDALRPAYDALVDQRDQLQDQAVPLRQQLADLDRGIERVQGAIDALEGREPDASAALRSPGALSARLPAGVRAAFSASPGGHPGRVTLNSEQVAEVRAALLDVLPIGEDHAIDRSEVTERVNRTLSFEVDKARVSRQLANLIETNDVARNYPDNPKDIRYWRRPAGESEGGSEG